MEEGDKEEMDDDLLNLLTDDTFYYTVCSRISKEIGEKSLDEALELGCEKDSHGPFIKLINRLDPPPPGYAPWTKQRKNATKKS